MTGIASDYRWEVIDFRTTSRSTARSSPWSHLPVHEECVVWQVFGQVGVLLACSWVDMGPSYRAVLVFAIRTSLEGLLLGHGWACVLYSHGQAGLVASGCWSWVMDHIWDWGWQANGTVGKVTQALAEFTVNCSLFLCVYFGLLWVTALPPEHGLAFLK